MKTRRILFLMDPYSTLNLQTETSLLMMKELLALDEEVYWCEMEDLSLLGADLKVEARRVESVSPFRMGEAQEEGVEGFHALVIRKDPPFDRNYLHLTYLLEHCPPSVVQVNPARALRRFNEKLFGLRWPHLTPPTLTSMNQKAILAFLHEQKEVVLKPLDDCSGRGIHRLHHDEEGLEETLKSHLRDEGGSPRFLTVQKFLPQIAEGDKRIYLVGGKPIGLVNRVPKEGCFLGNIHQGAKCVAASLSERDHEIIRTIGPTLKEEGLFLVGLDVIGGLITEINLTSPSAIVQINQVMGMELEKTIVAAMMEYVEERLAEL